MPASRTEAMIAGRGIFAGYGPTTILRGIDFAFPARGTSVVLGPGGAGKTTLARILSGSERQPADFWHRGELVLPDVAPSVLRQRLPTDGSVAELVGGCDGVSPPADGPWDPAVFLRRFWQASPEVAEKLVGALDQPVESLDRGLRRLVAFTVAVGSSSSYLLLDEPDADLEPEEIEWVVRKLRELRGTKTVIVITHHLQVARHVGDHVALLVDGVVCEAAPAEAFFTRPAHPRTRHFIRMGS